nr:unnamed protein product [Callosobruchus analis]
MSKPKAMDYFKIVAVIKKKRVEYTYVPHKWEDQNILYWPPTNLSALRTNPSTEPCSDWRPYPCKVKKTHIYGLQEAELWEQQFVDEGTDAEGFSVEDLRKSKTPHQEHQSAVVGSYDHEFEAINSTQNNAENNIVVIDNPSSWVYDDRNVETCE